MLELYNTAPQITPKPYGWGRVASEPCLYFYVCDFIPLTHAMPEPVKLAKVIADLHKTSVSPTGKFGFHLPTYDGWQPQEVGQWDDSWTSCFARLLKGLWELDSKMNGNWAELDAAMETTLAEVIPRLIGILERDGRSIKPCLIHGDLWETNIGTDATTGNIYIFDAAVYYAHNEMEIGIWRVNHHKMKAKIYRQEYAKQFKKSDPVEEWDDRLKLYGVKTKLMYSAGVPGGTNIRQQLVEDLQDLIEKYGSKLTHPVNTESTNSTTANAIAFSENNQAATVLHGEPPVEYHRSDTVPTQTVDQVVNPEQIAEAVVVP